MLRTLFQLLATVLLAVLAGCGSTSDGEGAKTFGLQSCSLGCNGTSFAVNTWQVNKDIIFNFSDTVDPASVSFTSISIIDRANGSTPSGQFLVLGTKVVFRPALIETNAGLLFGFNDGSVYDIRILDESSPASVRSMRGQRNQSFLTGDLTMNGIADLVPGPPTVVATLPPANQPPTNRDFQIEVVFGDIMQTLPLANPETGQSTLITVEIADTIAGTTSSVSGQFSSSIDRDALTTTIFFEPDVPYPGSGGGQRIVQVSLSQQIADLVGNLLQGAGTYTIPLPNLPTVTGAIVESFDDHANEYADGSTLGLWAEIPGTLDSGLDATTGTHHGGGSGVLGPLVVDAGGIILDTDSAMVPSALLGEDVAVIGGVFPYSEIQITAGGLILGTGSNALRLFSAGAIVVDGAIAADGASASANFGKYYFAEFDAGERIVNEPTTNMVADQRNGGGEGGQSELSGGSGGKGGQAWYYQSEGTGNQVYYKTSTFPGSNFWNWQMFGLNLAVDRFKNSMAGAKFCGSNGGGVGGLAALGDPIQNFNLIADDLANGSGMGSWAWPPTSNRMVDQNLSGAVKIDTHVIRDGNGAPLSRDNHAIHRSRGGGGGGYWTDGTRGGYFDQAATDPIGRALFPDFEPYIDQPNQIWEFNGDGSGNDWLMWDAQATTPAVADAEGGQYLLTVGQNTLDPDAGYLLGGAGGGGAGMSEHGSYAGAPALGNGNLANIGTYRSDSGAGGGSGGGALQLHAGSRMVVTGSVSARGGAGGDSEFMLSVPYSENLAVELGTPGDAGGGGGSGGSILLQTGGPLQMISDGIDVNGGRGGLGSAGNHGGSGGSGVVRFDTPTGGESLTLLQDLVTPNEAVELSPIGMPNAANVGALSASMPGATGDIMASDATFFNGNASSVRSNWIEADSGVAQCKIDEWTIECEYSDGLTVQTLTYSTANLTKPGVTPVWVALQTAWLEVGASAQPNPVLMTQSDWVLPDVLAFGDGLTELNRNVIRAIRFQIAFDQDLVQALIGNNAAAYFRVVDVRFDYTGD